MKIKTALLLGFLALGLSMPASADEDTNRRLKVIEEKQDEILLRLDSIQKELEIVKVRASN